MEEKIKKLSEKYLERVMELRRELHKYPEIGFDLLKTVEIVKKELDRIGIPYKSEIAKTGIVATIKGGKPGKTVLLRADMDALPLAEESRCDFKSTHEGKMHACGHDGHTAGLLGVGMILNELKDELSGNIKLLFQPAEEEPGEAKPMIDEGVLENPKVDAAFGCHIWPSIKAGHVAIKDGAMMSHPTTFEIIFQGKGGHASQPENTVDTVMVACQTVVNFQNIISRNISTLKPAVLSCCSIHAGEAHNIIPDKLFLKGTIRSFDEKITDNIIERMDEILKGLTNAYGASYEFLVDRMYPPLKNDHELFNFSKNALENILGKDNVEVMEDPVMGSEDFAYFGKHIPSFFFFVGVNDEQLENENMLHHPKLFWDEKYLIINMKTLSQLAVEFLNFN